MSGVFPLYIGKSEDDQRVHQHLEKIKAEGGNASGWVKEVLLREIQGNGHVVTSEDKLDEILRMLKSGVLVAQGQPAPLPVEADGDDADVLKGWLAGAEASF